MNLTQITTYVEVNGQVQARHCYLKKEVDELLESMEQYKEKLDQVLEVITGKKVVEKKQSNKVKMPDEVHMLKYLRVVNRMHMKELSKRTGVEIHTINNWEAKGIPARKENGKKETLRKLCEFFRVTLRDLDSMQEIDDAYQSGIRHLMQERAAKTKETIRKKEQENAEV